jgi:hypothetical protein
VGGGIGSVVGGDPRSRRGCVIGPRRVVSALRYNAHVSSKYHPPRRSARPRPARPSDIVPLVAFDGRVYPNEAHTWDRLGNTPQGPHVLGSAFEQWFSFATGRPTWVSVQGQTVRGVVSARRRASRLAWEIDSLIAADENVESIALTLLDQVVGGAVRAGAHKLFLRLEAGSELLGAAHRAGFVPFARETLLKLCGPHPAEVSPSTLHLRPHQKGDAYTLYQLYTRSTPVEARRVEAATFQEWLAAQEERGRGRGRVNLIGEQQSRAMAWVRAGRDGDVGRLDIVVHPDSWPETEALLTAGLQGLRHDQPVFCVVRDHALPVRERLEAAGFTPIGEYVCLAKRLALPVRALRPQRVRVPAIVKPLIAKPLAPAISDTALGTESAVHLLR